MDRLASVTAEAPAQSRVSVQLIEHRRQHYMKAGLLPSQFADLEEPRDALVVDISLPPEVILQQLLAQLRARS